MANSFPTSLNAYTGSETLSAAGHAQAHNAYESKIGTGSSTPTSSTFLRGTGTGTSAWQQVTLTTDVTGTLPVANGGTGLATLTSGNVLTGNGAGAVTLVATTGSSSFVRATSPTLVTPVLGAATATSINGLTISSSTGVLTITNGKTLTATNTLTLSGTDSTVMTFPSTSATVAGLATTQTLSNKRVTRRVVVTTQSATPTINTDNTDIASITALGQAITSMTTNLSGTPVNGDTLWISITDDGTARLITWGTSFEASGNVALPTTTVLSTRLDVLFTWNTVTSKWRCIAVS